MKLTIGLLLTFFVGAVIAANLTKTATPAAQNAGKQELHLNAGDTDDDCEDFARDFCLA